MSLSQHAATRCQQRGIPPLIVDWLLAYGAEQRSAGATRRFFDKEARRRLAHDFGAAVVDRMGDLLNLYLVEGSGQVVTVAVRQRRIKRSN
ncbi:MAG: hypothetical protein RJA98_2147 [Pseudomonadota bacterium]|jgi:hypothetical protein